MVYWSTELIFIQIVKIEIEQTSWLINILIIQGNKSVFEIKWNGCSISINCDKAASSLIINSKITLNEV